jgi:hypothetical protein
VVDRNGQRQLRRLHTLFDVVEGGDLGEVIRMARHGESLVLCQPQCIVSLRGGLTQSLVSGHSTRWARGDLLRS